MKNSYLIKVLLLVVIIFFVISCSDKNKIGDKNKKEISYQESIYQNISIEKVLERFSKNSKKNKIKLEKMERLNYDGKSFYYGHIVSDDRTNYMLEYNGIDIKGLFLKVDSINIENLITIENFVVNLIEISDINIGKEEAEAIYNELLSNMKQNELMNFIEYKNGLTYGLKIDNEKGQFIFFVQ